MHLVTNDRFVGNTDQAQQQRCNNSSTVMPPTTMNMHSTLSISKRGQDLHVKARPFLHSITARSDHLMKLCYSPIGHGKTTKVTDVHQAVPGQLSS